MKTRRGSGEWKLAIFLPPRWAVATAFIKNSKTLFPFISVPFLQAHRRPDSYLGSQTSDKKFPWQLQISFPALYSLYLQGHFSSLNEGFESHPHNPRIQHPLPATCWAERNGGGWELLWQKNVSWDPRRDYKSNESCLYNKFELGRIYPVEGFQW